MLKGFHCLRLKLLNYSGRSIKPGAENDSQSLRDHRRSSCPAACVCQSPPITSGNQPKPTQSSRHTCDCVSVSSCTSLTLTYDPGREGHFARRTTHSASVSTSVHARQTKKVWNVHPKKHFGPKGYKYQKTVGMIFSTTLLKTCLPLQSTVTSHSHKNRL